MTLQKEHDDLQADCMYRLGLLRGLIDDITRKVATGSILNDLGEIQGVANITDCRIAGLAVVRLLLSKIADEKAKEKP